MGANPKPKMWTHCTTGALCNPPLDSGGVTEYAADARFPSCWIGDPAIPGVDEIVKPGCNCQHSKMDLLLAAEMTVRFREVGGGGAAAHAGTRDAAQRTRGMIACIF